MKLNVAVVPHTHWDREWYSPFQTFRMRLVKVLDSLLDILEEDPSYAHFLLDGQMAMVDDYLEIRPEAAARIHRLASAGRLSMGPWYILMDEFLVSAETIIRDLQLGMERASSFGGSMEVGYLPDMFGHVAQMPQILRLAGFTHAVVWRGVPSSIDRDAFWWEAPDGSEVRATYLVTGYSNGQAIPDDANALVSRVDAYLEEVGSFLTGDLLYMNGTDHQAPQPWLGRVVDEANSLETDLHFEVTSLTRYLQQATIEGLPRHQGELRSGARANLLMGVASNRVDVKQAAARTERALERRAEPFAALFAGPESWPGSLLDLAWLSVIRNAAHDSICACSVDEVVEAVIGRFAEARQIADGVAGGALEELSASMTTSGVFVVNPSQRARGGVVEALLRADLIPADAPVQVLDERGGTAGVLSLDSTTVRTVLAMLQGTQVGADTWVQDVTVTEGDEDIYITIALGPTERTDLPVEDIKRDIANRLDARPQATVNVRMDQPAMRRVLARVQGVEGFGWARLAPVQPVNPVSASWTSSAPSGATDHSGPAEDHAGPAEDHAGTLVISNGLVTLEMDATEMADGTFSMNGIPGYGRLVDGGDWGDSYNYSPPQTDHLVDHPETVEVTLLEAGPLRARASLKCLYRWPWRVDPATSTRSGWREVEVLTTLEMRADETLVRISTVFTNPCLDHRLRVHLPLPEPAGMSRAECAFAVVERPLAAEGRPDELGLPTFPSRRFVMAGGLCVAHEGLAEYELVEIEDRPEGRRAGAMALTLLRSTGMLSRLGMSYRPLPAGPLTPVEGLQMEGRRIEAHYALCHSCSDPYGMVDEAFLGLEVIESIGGGTRPDSGSALRVTGAEVSAVRRVPGGLEVRVFNPTPFPAEVSLGGRPTWLVDLRGRPLERSEGSFTLRPFGIATLRITG